MSPSADRGGRFRLPACGMRGKSIGRPYSSDCRA
jgi:hypothetical protein